MDVKSVRCAYFSPTGTTGAIAREIVHAMGWSRTTVFSFTMKSQRERKIRMLQTELIVLAVPVYYGRVPEAAAQWLSTLSGEDTPAVLVVVYGNRAYDDALRELYDIVMERGFVPVAAGAFIGEHSYSSMRQPIAHGRPDKEDMEKAKIFGDAVRRKLDGLDSLGAMAPLAVPGNVPYREPENLYRIKSLRQTVSYAPETDMSRCTRCDLCANICPGEAIDRDDPAKTDKGKCILCFACVKACPPGAREMEDISSSSLVRRMYETCQARKEPEYYL
jgi:ferredoxin/flavodoxin